jgi:hypothetical protein
MKSKFAKLILVSFITIVILITSSITGCIDLTPAPSFIQAPRLLIDYDNETATFEIYIHGIEDCKYDFIEFNATSLLDNESIMESKNNTYALIQIVPFASFTLYVTVKADKTLYEHNTTVELETSGENGDITLTITSISGGKEIEDKLDKADLPYITYFKRQNQ